MLSAMGNGNRIPRWAGRAAWWLVGTWLLLGGTAAAATLPSFDFTEAAGQAGWEAQHDIVALTPTAEGLAVTLGGADPYLAGPARDYPAGTPLWMRLRLKSERGGWAQVFYFTGAPTEAQSVRFAVAPGEWQEVTVRMPPLGAGTRLRIDPPGEGGVCVLGFLGFEPRVVPQAPAWPVPQVPDLGVDPVVLRAGDMELRHGRSGLGAFEVWVKGVRMACGNAAALLGYLHGGESRWAGLGQGPGTRVTIQNRPRQSLADREVGGSLLVRATFKDPDGGNWEVEQTFTPGEAGTIGVSTRCVVDQDRDVLYLPALTLLPGLGGFGTNKVQGLLAGVEYLENEPSSSTADLNPPASHRQVPDLAKVTFPLMAIAAEGRYLGVLWSRAQTNVGVVFDTPDRFFNSGGHLLGLLVPGSDGMNREENSLLPYDPMRFPADRGMTVSAMILGGVGDTVIPAVQQYVRIEGLPPVPAPGMSAQAYYALAGRGWLDSKIRDGDWYRHAAPGFGSGPAADAALYLDWLAGRVEDSALADRLRNGARAALAQVMPGERNARQVGHVRYPAPALVYGAVSENVASARGQAGALLRRFEADGSVVYRKTAGGLDFGSTHWAPDANGLTAQGVMSLLEAAVFGGDRAQIDQGLRLLRALDKFRGTVPRGAQTWEIPLHTPDILASAYLVRAYTLGYELTGDAALLEEARYWAWTGLPFVYLTPPTSGPVGVYSTIAVLGATSWVAPVWIGLPVQWCGLVYADALQRLAPHDSRGPWMQVANGIAAAGIQHTYPDTDTEFRGLLPDSFNLRAQTRNGPAINPATTLVPAIRMLGGDAVYGFVVLRQHGLCVHAPGAIDSVREDAAGARFRVQGWPAGPYFVLINGLRDEPTVRVNGQETPLSPPHQYSAAEGFVVLQIEGATEELSLGFARRAVQHR